VKWRFISVGKPSLQYAKGGLEEYLKRLRRYVSVEHVSVKNGPREEEQVRLLAASEGCYRMVFDERGELLTTRELAGVVTDLEMDGTVKSIALIIGGAEGHGEAMRRAADRVISFGRLTLQHELALVAAAEQVYRVYSLKRGEPYHR
jgi:23S rRNA (pseudouridine1915-N3)-methyltransferase